MRYILLLVCAVAALGQQPVGAPFDVNEYELGKRKEREIRAFIEQNRLDPAGFLRLMQAGARAPALPDRGDAVQSSPAWEFLGPRNQSGRITGLGVTRADTNHWFCSADGGGIWESRNGGSSWQPLGDTLPDMRIGTMALSPWNDALMLASASSGLLYRTTDAGATWQTLTPQGMSGVSEFQFHPIDPRIAYAAGWGGLWRSRDSGVTWSSLKSGTRGVTITISVVNPSIMLYAENDGSGLGHVYRTTDAGGAWTDVLSGQLGYWAAVRARISRSDPSIAFADLSDRNLFYRSSDGGVNWTQTPTQPHRDGYNNGFDQFEISPTDPNLVISGGTTIFRTSDGGDTWSGGDTNNTGVHVDQHFFLFPLNMPGTFIAGNDGGVFRTYDPTTPALEWFERDTDLVTLEIYNCAMHPNVPDTVIVGCQDNGYDKHSGNQTNWLVAGGDGFCTIYDPQTPSIFFHEYIYENLHRAKNGFTWWSEKVMNGLPTDNTSNGFYTGIITPDRADWYGQAVAMWPEDSHVLYLGTNHLYRTTDEGDQWVERGTMEFGSNQYDLLTSIAFRLDDPAILILGTQYGELYLFDDNQPVPTITTITPPGGTGDRVRGIASDKLLPRTILVNGNGANGHAVWRTTDGGATWDAASDGLPRTWVNRIIADPDSAHTFYAAASNGLYATRDAGTHWVRVPGLPNVEIWDLAFHTATRTMLVGTYGRGAIRMKNFIPPPASPNSVAGQLPAPPFAASIAPMPVRGGATLSITLEREVHPRVDVMDVIGRTWTTIDAGRLSAGAHRIGISPSALSILTPGAYVAMIRGDRGTTAVPFVFNP